MPTLELPIVASARLGWPAWAYVALVLLLIVGARASRRALESGEELPPPGRLYPQLAVQLLLILVVTWLVARASGVDLSPRGPPTGAHLLAGLAVLVLMLVAAVVVWRHTPAAERARGVALVPCTPAERLGCVLVACLAGLAEECAWRALLPALLLAWTGNAWLAVGLAALTFGLAHWVQGRLAMLVVFLVALAFQALVVATGDLLVAIGVHALYDSLVGLWLAPYLRRGAAGASPSP